MSLNRKLEDLASALGRWINSHPLWWFAAVSILLHILRQPEAIIHAQFWAEDGKEFFRDDFIIGPSAFLKTYAGYLHFWPRSVAFILGFFPLLWLPLLYKLFALFTHGILLAIIAGRRFPGDHLQKAVIMLIIALVPHNGEAYLNLANTISFCCLIMSAICISRVPDRWSARILEMVMLFVLACSGPYIFFVFPLAFVYWLFQPLKSGVLRIFGLASGLALQISVFSIAGRPEDLAAHPAFSVWAKALRVTFKCLVFGKVGFPKVIEWLMAAFVFGALLICFWPSVRDLFLRRLRFSPALFLVGVGVANLAASMWVARIYLDVIGPFSGASRYFFLTYILILWAVVLDWDVQPHAKLRKYLIGLSLFFSVLNFTSMMPKDNLHWAEQVDELRREGKVEMKVLPPRTNWIFEVNSEGAWRTQSNWTDGQ